MKISLITIVIFLVIIGIALYLLTAKPKLIPERVSTTKKLAESAKTTPASAHTDPIGSE